MNNMYDNNSNTTPDQTKKSWSKPAFEIISKEIIKTGAFPGPEGVTTPGQSTIQSS